MGTGKEDFNTAVCNLFLVFFIPDNTFNLDRGQRVLRLIKSLTCSSDCLVTAKGNKIFQRELDADIIFKVLCYIFFTQLNQSVSQNLFKRLVCLGKKVNVIQMNCCFCIVSRVFNPLA